MEKAVVLISGGMDSATLLHYVKMCLNVSNIYALSFCYGQKHSCELEMAKWQATQADITDHKEIDISFFQNLIRGGSALTDSEIEVPDLSDINQDQLKQPPTYVPHRNLMFLSLASAYAESIGVHDVFYGAQTQDEYGYWDCTIDFVDKINCLLKLNHDKAVTVHAPFVEKSKADVLRMGISLGVDFSHTWTCYRGDKTACGKCPSCVERTAAFKAVGVKDNIIF